MTRKNILLSFILLFLLGAIDKGEAKPRSEQEAKAIARKIFNSSISLRSSSYFNSLSLVGKEKKKTNTLRSTVDLDEYYYYVYNRGNNEGFAIISGDDEFPSVIGYADEGSISMDNLPEGLRFYLEACRKKMDTPKEKITQSNNLLKETPSKSLPRSVSPLLNDIKWDQGSPWNNKTPKHRGSSTVVGCVATAYAQIMRFWKWPDRGEGSFSYSYSYDYKGSYGEQRVERVHLTANFDKKYDWDKMPATASSKTSAEENEALATLCSDAGIAVEMQYGNSSGAHTPRVLHALKSYFRYDKGASMEHAKNYTTEAWCNLLKKELAEGRPMLYDGGGQGGFHAFVCDGYDDKGNFHFNWGWSGAGNGFYSLYYLLPNRIGVGAGGGEYSEGQGAIIGIKPDKTKTSQDPKNSWLATERFSSDISGGDAFYIESASFVSRIEDASVYNGEITLGLYNLETKQSIPITELATAFSSNLYYSDKIFTITDKKIDFAKYGISEGTWLLTPMHTMIDATGAKVWRRNGILWEGGSFDKYAVYKISRNSDGFYLIEKKPVRALWSLEIDKESISLVGGISNSKANISFILKNTGWEEYSNRILVRGRRKNSSLSHSGWKQVSRRMGSIAPGESKKFELALSDDTWGYQPKDLFAANEIELQVAYYDVIQSLDYLTTTTYLVPVKQSYEANKKKPVTEIPREVTYPVSFAKIGRGTIKVQNEKNEEIRLSDVKEGTTIKIIATPGRDYVLKALTANGQDILSKQTFTIKAETTIVATFEDSKNPMIPPKPQEVFKVNLQQPSEGGTISIVQTSIDLTKVPKDTELKVKVKPQEGYELASLKANDLDIMDSKTFRVTSEITITATFKKKTFAVLLPQSIKGGTVSINGHSGEELLSVVYGTELVVDVNTDEGYELVSLNANTLDITKDKKFIVKEETTLTATFQQKVFAVALTTEGEGMLTIENYSKEQLVAIPYGALLTIKATPAEGYELETLTANEMDIKEAMKVEIKEATTIKASFKKINKPTPPKPEPKKKTFAVTIEKAENGTIEVVEKVDLKAVEEGTTLTLKATPAKGYELETLTANGKDIKNVMKVEIKEATTLKATFKRSTAIETVDGATIHLYPNPATNFVRVEGTLPHTAIMLYTMEGRRLLSAQSNAEGSLTLDLSAYNEGIYLLLLDGNSYRLVIRR